MNERGPSEGAGRCGRLEMKRAQCCASVDVSGTTMGPGSICFSGMLVLATCHPNATASWHHAGVVIDRSQKKEEEIPVAHEDKMHGSLTQITDLLEMLSPYTCL